MAFAMSGLLFVAFPFVTAPILLFVLQIFAGFFMGLVLPLLMGQSLKNIPKEKKGTAEKISFGEWVTEGNKVVSQWTSIYKNGVFLGLALGIFIGFMLFALNG